MASDRLNPTPPPPAACVRSSASAAKSPSWRFAAEAGLHWCPKMAQPGTYIPTKSGPSQFICQSGPDLQNTRNHIPYSQPALLSCRACAIYQPAIHNFPQTCSPKKGSGHLLGLDLSAGELTKQWNGERVPLTSNGPTFALPPKPNDLFESGPYVVRGWKKGSFTVATSSKRL